VSAGAFVVARVAAQRDRDVAVVQQDRCYPQQQFSALWRWDGFVVYVQTV
jgi:hypothetical protein